jgi:hypothetical protein
VLRNRLTAILAVVTLAAALALAGCASRSAEKTAYSAESAVASGKPSAAAAAVGGEVHIMAYSIDSDGPGFRAILAGAVGDYGPAVTVGPKGKVDPEHTSQLELKLVHGSFRLSIASIGKKITSAYRHRPANPRTCSGSISFTAAAPVVTGSGDGAYQGISGSFMMTVTIDEVDAKPVCNGTSRFLAQVIWLAGSGTVSF